MCFYCLSHPTPSASHPVVSTEVLESGMHELMAPAAYRGGMAEKAARDILIKHRAAKSQLKFGSVFQYLEEKGESKIQTSVQMILALGC